MPLSPDDQDAEAEDVHQHGVHASCARRASPRGSTSAWRSPSASTTGGLEQRQPRALGLDDQLRRRREAAGDERRTGKSSVSASRSASDARGRRRGSRDSGSRSRRRSGRGPGLQVLVEAGQREAGLLDVRAGDEAVEAVGAGQQLERQAERLGAAAEQAADGDARRWGRLADSVEHDGISTAPCADSTSESSAPRGTSRSCAAPARAPRAAGC